jgi:hypothetical protein
MVMPIMRQIAAIATTGSTRVAARAAAGRQRCTNTPKINGDHHLQDAAHPAEGVDRQKGSSEELHHDRRHEWRKQS